MKRNETSLQSAMIMIAVLFIDNKMLLIVRSSWTRKAHRITAACAIDTQV